MRYSAKHTKQSRNIGYFIFIIFIILIFFGSAGWLGSKVGNWLNPIFNPDKASVQQTQKPSDMPYVTSNNTDTTSETPIQTMEVMNQQPSTQEPRETSTIDLPNLNFYALQLGAFGTMENASVLKNEVIPRGAAGYILNSDNLFRVFAMGYFTKADADIVKDQLLTQGIDASVHQMGTMGARITITAPKSRIETMNTALMDWPAIAHELSEIILSIENKSKTNLDALTQVANINSKLIDTKQKVDDYLSSQPDQTVLANISQMYEVGLKAIKVIESNNIRNTNVSSGIKNALITFVVEYDNFIKNIT